jgi:hypothetical protein
VRSGAFCDALEKAARGSDCGGGTENLTRWVAWARAAADRIDPTRGSAALSAVDFDVGPRPKDLRPFLGDWSPHRPEREYRTDRDEQQLADIRTQATPWHPGMRGRSTWWRHR